MIVKERSSFDILLLSFNFCERRKIMDWAESIAKIVTELAKMIGEVIKDHQNKYRDEQNTLIQK